MADVINEGDSKIEVIDSGSAPPAAISTSVIVASEKPPIVPPKVNVVAPLGAFLLQVI